MPTTTYRLCTIERTTTTTGSQDGKPLRNVYRVSGRYEYSPALRPFLTSLKDAKEWIDRRTMSPKSWAAEVRDVGTVRNRGMKIGHRVYCDRVAEQ